jgi:hypothetical protein
VDYSSITFSTTHCLECGFSPGCFCLFLLIEGVGGSVGNLHGFAGGLGSNFAVVSVSRVNSTLVTLPLAVTAMARSNSHETEFADGRELA